MFDVVYNILHTVDAWLRVHDHFSMLIAHGLGIITGICICKEWRIFHDKTSRRHRPIIRNSTTQRP